MGDLEALAATKHLLAANFRDNAELMPQFIKQVWLLAALLPSNSLFVSIYESGSKKALTGKTPGFGMGDRFLGVGDLAVCRRIILPPRTQYPGRVQIASISG